MEASIGVTSSSGMFIFSARLTTYSSVTSVSSWKRSFTMPNFPFTEPKPDRNQITMELSRMTVPARLMKDQPRSQVPRRTFTAEGT